MKKELFYYSILILVIAGLLLSETLVFSTKTENASKVIQFDDFNKLDIDLACTLYVSIGDEQKIVIEGPEKYLDLLETKMDDGILKISCKKIGLLSHLFGPDATDEQSLNVYIKLTSADQLITPKKGNLISIESSLYRESDSFTFLNRGIKGILKVLGTQLGLIRIL